MEPDIDATLTAIRERLHAGRDVDDDDVDAILGIVERLREERKRLDRVVYGLLDKSGFYANPYDEKFDTIVDDIDTLYAATAAPERPKE